MVTVIVVQMGYGNGLFLTRVVHQNATILPAPDLVPSDLGVAAGSVNKVNVRSGYTTIR